MADTHEFFQTTLPERIANNPALSTEINAIYVFDIDGAGQWTVDLTSAGGGVSEGTVPDPGCTVNAAKADFEALLDNPAQATMLFMSSKLKVSDIPLGMKLQKLLQ